MKRSIAWSGGVRLKKDFLLSKKKKGTEQSIHVAALFNNLGYVSILSTPRQQTCATVPASSVESILTTNDLPEVEHPEMVGPVYAPLWLYTSTMAAAASR